MTEAARLGKPAAVYTFNRYPKQRRADYGPGLGVGSGFDGAATRAVSFPMPGAPPTGASTPPAAQQQDGAARQREEENQCAAFPGFIQSEEERLRCLEAEGVDCLYIQNFDDSFSSCPAREFFEQLCAFLEPVALVCGEDFRFGKGREGDSALLRQLCEEKQMLCFSSRTLSYRGEKISSTRIREAVRRGDMQLVRSLMGRPFRSLGEVLHGQSLGHTFGIPTANIRPTQSKVQPPFGVYLSFTKIGDRLYRSVTNFGKRPSVHGDSAAPLFETYVYDFSGDLYGQVIEISLLEFLRPETRFPSFLAMTNQISADLETARLAHRRREAFEHTYDMGGTHGYRLQLDRFSTGHLDLLFYLPVEKVKRSAFAVLASYLTAATKEHPDEASFSAWLEDKYAADFYAVSDVYGDVFVFRIGMSAIKHGPQERKPFYECLCYFLRQLSEAHFDEEGNADPALFAIEKEKLRMRLRARRREPDWLSWQGALRLVFDDPLLYEDAEGSPEELESLRPEDLFLAYRQLWTEAERVLVLSGAIDEEETLKVREFMRLSPRKQSGFHLRSAHRPGFPTPKEGRRGAGTHTAELTHLRLLYTGLPPYNSAEMIAFDLLAELLAGDTSSLLFEKLRNERGYVYSIDTDLDPYLGLLSIHFATSPGNMEEAQALTERLLLGLRTERLPDELIDRAKQFIINNLLTESDDLADLVDHHLEERFAGRYLPIDVYLDWLKALTAEDVRRAAEQLRFAAAYRLDPRED